MYLDNKKCKKPTDSVLVKGMIGWYGLIDGNKGEIIWIKVLKMKKLTLVVCILKILLLSLWYVDDE